MKKYEFSYQWDWDTRVLQPSFCDQSHKASVTDVAISKDSSTVFSVGKDTLFKMHNVTSLRQERSISLSGMILSSIMILEDGNTALAGCWDSSM